MKFDYTEPFIKVVAVKTSAPLAQSPSFSSLDKVNETNGDYDESL